MTSHPADVIRVAAIQAEAIPGDIEGNVRTAARLCAAAAERGARIAVLPELFISAYHPPVLGADPDGTDLRAAADGTLGDPRLDPLRKAAASDGIIILIGAALRRVDGRRTISALLVDTAGMIRAAYDKQHLCGTAETDLFVPGTGGATVTIDGWRFGLGICYDGCFPEHARAAAADGADAYLVPAAYQVGSEHRRDVYYAARALDNGFYVVFANCVGGVDPWFFNGGAAIYEPEGRALARSPDAGEHVAVADLDRAQIAHTRAYHSMLADRLPALGTRTYLDLAEL